MLSKPFVVPEEEEDGRKKGKKKIDGEPKAAAKPAKVRKEPPVVSASKIFRVMFNEITPKAIKAAFEHPGEINENLVDAQQARRVLDRLVGYKISPLLWDKVRRGLSAGRVQTVALRLIVDRELEIRAFVPGGILDDPRASGRRRAARRSKPSSPNTRAKTSKSTRRPKRTPFVGRELEQRQWKVASVTQKEKRRFAPPPFTTSKLQQAAYNRLRYTAKRTMGLAQRLYEGVELGAGRLGRADHLHAHRFGARFQRRARPGARPDSVQDSARPYLPEKPNFYKSKKDAQDAHEAIRPTDASRTPEDVRPFLSDDMFKAVPADLAAVRGFADGAGGVRPDHHRRDAPATTRFAPPARCRSSTATWPCIRSVKDEDEEEAEGDAEDKALLPPVARRRDAAARNHAPRPAFHRAAAALHRSDAGERAGRKGHRAPLDLRFDHFDDRRARIRHQGPGPICAHDAGRKE